MSSSVLTVLNVRTFRLQGVTGGIMRGVGKQRVGALCTLVGYYFVGLPIGLSLMFLAGMGIVGKDGLSIKCEDFTVIPHHQKGAFLFRSVARTAYLRHN